MEMNSLLRLKYLPVAACLALALAACGQAPVKLFDIPKETAVPAITEAARDALSQAEADVEAARARFALWTTAESALKLARDAAQAGNSELVSKHAALASGQARAGVVQLAYPSTEPQ
jgi:hypothetical protein